ncbi:pepsinogen [Theileria orientalis strain Shintoku]|uniref:Pepsinogen n=1 Tax=Theileria orientalis strain Shintoku TaxID=869250 RepID=J4DPT8_THEOR|nr:pepsinogen [Theileria orientalis strain Shintoku]PVC49741.1 pepsinogen [Theileria orientalis]BAM41279.1 pepsinogen [Theileria orientalis strain Shintoku]|eukprot:XP_009691580.1 pepsinogen [Theileria orientalis strain Shintoku]
MFVSKIILNVVLPLSVINISLGRVDGETNNYVSQIKRCSDCSWSTVDGCRVCLHEGHNSQRYGKSGSESVSTIQLAKDNLELFKNGKISFALRSEGPFGSLGFNEKLHGSNFANVYNNEPKNTSRLRHHSSVLSADEVNEYIPLNQIKDSLYVGSMYVGSPPQLMHPIFDTGSTNMWVVGTNCDSETCKKVKRFNPSLSNTFKALAKPKRIHIRFGTGEIEGKPAKDVVKIGGMSFEQAFAVVEKENDPGSDFNVFERINFEGIVGLAFSEMSSIKAPSVLENLTKLNLLSHNEFSFYIGEDTRDALLMFGGANSEFYEGELKMFPVVREHYWEVALDEIYLGAEKICCKEKSYLIFDSGTSLNSVPSSEYSDFLSMIDKVRPQFPNSCFRSASVISTVSPSPTCWLGGEKIVIEPSQYIYKQGDHCTPAYMQLDVPSQFGHAYVLGSSGFMRYYFTLFRMGSGERPSMVGVAPAKRGPEVSKRARELALMNSEF